MQPEELYIDKDFLSEGVHDLFSFKAVFVCGSPGSGKTTIEKKLGLEARGLKALNADYTMFRLKNLRQNMTNADYPHAGQTTENRFNLWSNNFLGLILNTTGRDLNTIVRLNKKLQDFNYSTFMLFVDVDEKIARDRIESRYANTDNLEDKNRVVDLEYFEQAYKAVHQNLEKFSNMFDDTNLAVVRNDDFNLLTRDFEIARKKLNKFLMSPPTPEAQAILKGIKNDRNPGLGRKFATI